MNELVENLIKHFKSEGKECSYVGLSAGKPIILFNDKKYSLQLSNYGNDFSIVPCQQIILIPEK